jgi:hypothetical protein
LPFNIAIERLRWGITRHNMVSDETNMAWLKSSADIGRAQEQVGGGEKEGEGSGLRFETGLSRVFCTVDANNVHVEACPVTHVFVTAR